MPEQQAIQEGPQGEINLSLREHNVAFVLPFGARMEGKLLLPCGALIYGDFSGDIFCESGSIIVKKGGRFKGMAEADKIYIEGEVSPVDERRRSVLIARQLIAGSSASKINADVFSAAYALHKAKIWGTLRTLEEGNAYRTSNKAIERLGQSKGSAKKPQEQLEKPAETPKISTKKSDPQRPKG
jgi:cytoskeletal protein CcmA (bactofilin family)